MRALTRRWAQEKHFDPVTAADWAETSLINASTLRYLLLDGAYLCDVPLRLPSLFVLQLGAGASIRPATNLSLDNTTTFTGLVEMSDVHFSAVVGGTVDASSLPAEAYEEVTTVKGGVSAGACGPGATLVRLAVAAAADTPAPGDGAGKE